MREAREWERVAQETGLEAEGCSSPDRIMNPDRRLSDLEYQCS